MIPAIDPGKHAESRRITADIEAFMAAGGQVERFRIGECRENLLTRRERINPQIAAAELAAKRKAEGRTGKRIRSAPKPPKPPREPKPPRVRVSKATGAKRGRRPAAPGTKARQILDLLASGPLTCAEVSAALGWDQLGARRPRQRTAQALDHLRRHKFITTGDTVTRNGNCPARTWRLA